VLWSMRPGAVFKAGLRLAVLAGVVLASGPGSGVLAQAPQPAGQQQPSEASKGWAERQIQGLKEWVGNWLGAGASSARSMPVAPAKAPPAPQVTVSLPVPREIVEWDEYTGRFEAVESVEVRARVSGYLDRVEFRDGQDVKAGDVLYVIDPRPFERALATARAELELAKTRAANAAKDVERGRPLVEKRILSEKGFDDRENLLREAEAAMKVAEARVRAAELDLSFTTIRAPIGGRISNTAVTPGNFVSAGGGDGATVLTTIVRQDPIYVYFDVGENNTLKYKRLAQAGLRAGATASGVTVQVALPDETGYPHRGLLDFSDNRLDPGTGTLRARARIDNKAGLFSPGMFARVRLAGSPRYTALLLPDEAIGTDQASKFVYVVGEDGLVQRRVVQLGPMVDGMRVIRQGVAAGDWVIIKGMQRARGGQKVAPRREQLEISGMAPAIDALEQ
jgi:RND family efflux transporter MFP subunit